MRPLAAALRSSAARLALLYLLILAASVSVLLATVYIATERAVRGEVDRVIAAESESLSERYEEGGVEQLITVLNRRVDDWGRIGAVYLLVDAADTRLAGNLSGWPGTIDRNNQWIEFGLDAREGGVPTEHTVRAGIYRLGNYRLLVGSDLSELQRFVERLRAATIWGVGLTTLLAALVGWWYSRRIASRVRAVAGACEHIISGNLAQRLPRDRSGDEFDQLTVAVNHMLDRVEQQTAVLRTTFGSAAHDLRTPLHRIRTRLESALQTAAPPPALQQPLADAVADLDRIQRTLSTLLQIAKADSGQSGQQFELLDLSQLATEICELYAPVARARQITLEQRCGMSAPLAGNRQLLAQLLVNLLENALKYSPDRSCIVVEVARTTAGVRLSVRDNGPGIPDAQRAEALLPFRRLDPQSELPGSGLGLSLVDAVVRLHHGSLQLADNDPGLAVHCDLPAAA